MCRRFFKRGSEASDLSSTSPDAQVIGDQKTAKVPPADQTVQGQQPATDRPRLVVTHGGQDIVILASDAWILLILGVVTGLASFIANLSQLILIPSPFPQLVGFMLILIAAILLMILYKKRLVRTLLTASIVLGTSVFAIWLQYALPLWQTDSDFLSERVETYRFANQSTDGWKPFDLDLGWMAYDKSGDLAITSGYTGLNSRCGGRIGQFLRYPLDLESENSGYKSRNAIYRPTDSTKTAGIIAQVCFTSDPGFGGRQIIGGFIAEDKTRIHESHTWKLEPNTWNTLVWSMDSPHYWAQDAQKDAKWQALQETFPADERNNLFVYQRLDNTGIDRIGFQFYVWPDGDSQKFKGTAYFDNIIIVYANP